MGFRAKAAILVVVLVLAPGIRAGNATANPSEQRGRWVYFVTKTDDTADGECDSDCSLREAIIAANQTATPDTVMLPAGTYVLTIEGSGEDNGETGDLDISAPLTIVGEGPESTIVDASGMTGDPDRVFEKLLSPTSYHVEIWGVTITGGDAIGLTGGGAGGRAGLGGGGGVHSAGGTLALNNCTVSGNSAAYLGGGIATDSVTLTNCTISGNTAEHAGGICAFADATLTNSTVSGNISTYNGGGIDGYHSLELTNSTVSGNSAGIMGGGILFEGDFAVTLTNSTVSGNSAGTMGGGIVNVWTGTVELKNSIVANNVPEDCGSGMTSNDHNLDSDDTCNLDQANDLPNADPRLGPLQDNGGPNLTHALLAGSPAIDAGDDLACPATDQRGYPRPMDGDGDGSAICDIGAFEAFPARCFVPLVLRDYGAP